MLMILSWNGLLTVSLLIGLTFIGGVGAALVGPTWQAIVPELVPKKDLKSAVALNSLGINVARSIGPASPINRSSRWPGSGSSCLARACR